MDDAETRWWPRAGLVLGVRHSQPEQLPLGLASSAAKCEEPQGVHSRGPKGTERCPHPTRRSWGTALTPAAGQGQASPSCAPGRLRAAWVTAVLRAWSSGAGLPSGHRRSLLPSALVCSAPSAGTFSFPSPHGGSVPFFSASVTSQEGPPLEREPAFLVSCHPLSARSCPWQPWS